MEQLLVNNKLKEMSVPNQQIGWSQKDKLLWNITKQLESLMQVASNVVLPTSSTTTTSTSTIAPTTTTTTTAIPIVTAGLILNLDASNASSYPGSGTTWTDLTGNGYNATAQGSIPYTSNGQASYFTLDGSISNYFLGNNTLYGTNSNQISGDVGITYSFAFSPSNVSGRSFLFSNYNGSRGYIFELGTLSGLWTNTLRNFVASGNVSDNRGSTPVLSNDTIYIITITWNQITKVAEMYVDGLLISSVETGVPNAVTPPWANGTNYHLGNWDAAGGTYGKLYSAYVYNRALSSTEVLQNYNALQSRFGL